LVDFLSTTAVVVIPSSETETVGTVQTLNVLPETDPSSNYTTTLVSFGNLFTILHSESLIVPILVTILDPASSYKTLPHYFGSSIPTKFEVSILTSSGVTNLVVTEVMDPERVPVATID